LADPQPTPPLVSCIIIFLDEERYLREAVESVMAQSYPHWELLLVDDGSSDASAEIAATYARESAGRIRYLTHRGGENRGMSASRNLGIAQARGEFVAFLDGDDAWLFDKLERQVALFAEHPPAQMVCGATLYWHEWQEGGSPDRLVCTGDILSGEGAGRSLLEQDRLYHPPELMTRLYPLGRGVTPSMSGVIVRSSLLQAIGKFEESFRGLFEDQVFRAKVFLTATVYVSADCFDRYRQHEESCWQSTRATAVAKDARRQYLAWLGEYLDRIDCRDSAVRSGLRRLLFRQRHARLVHMRSRLRAGARSWFRHGNRRNRN
jgi:glycosyltransferase involved in cell wall biosynthesis